MEANTLCLLLNKLHLISQTQHRFILTQIVPLHVWYMSSSALRPSSGTSIHRSCKRKHNTS